MQSEDSCLFWRIEKRFQMEVLENEQAEYGPALFYWHIDKQIQVEVLENERAEYVKEAISTLSRPLVEEFGKGCNYPPQSGMVQIHEAFREGLRGDKILSSLGVSK